jgi:hypothetical protein
MADSLHPMAPHDLPSFISAPGTTDSLMMLMMIGVPVAVLFLGATFFWLHTLPERLGHKKLQFEVVAVLGLISLFTHMHVFWIIGLLLALIDLPDLLSPLRKIADAAEKLAARPLTEAAGSPAPAMAVPAPTPTVAVPPPAMPPSVMAAPAAASTRVEPAAPGEGA